MEVKFVKWSNGSFGRKGIRLGVGSVCFSMFKSERSARHISVVC